MSALTRLTTRIHAAFRKPGSIRLRASVTSPRDRQLQEACAQGSTERREGAGSFARRSGILADAAGERFGHPRPGLFTQWCSPETNGARQAAHALAGSLNSEWDAEPELGRVADGVPDRAHRLKGLGNAVVPQIPELIGNAILQSLQFVGVFTRFTGERARADLIAVNRASPTFQQTCSDSSNSFGPAASDRTFHSQPNSVEAQHNHVR